MTETLQSREDMEVGVEYGGGNTEILTQSLREGDVIDVTRGGKSYPNLTLEVESSGGDWVDVRDKAGNEYILIAHTWVYPRSGTWLRRQDGFDSAGQVDYMTVISDGAK